MIRCLRWLPVCAFVGLAGCASDQAADSNASSVVSAPTKPKKTNDTNEPDEATPEPSGPKAGAIVVDLGTVRAGQTVEIDLPDTALGLHVAVSSRGAGTMGIETIVDPAGVVVHENFSAVGSPDAKNGEGHDGMGAAAVPQNDQPEAVRPRAGKWKVTFGGGGTNAFARARIQTAVGAKFAGGALDLHLHLPRGLTIGTEDNLHVIDAKAAPSDADLSARIDVFFDDLKRLFDVDRGTVSYHDVAAEFTAVPDDPTFYRAIATSTKGFPEDNAVHIILTNQLLENDYTGWSPGVPGAVSMMGNTMSGVVAALFPESDESFDGWLWLHEVGHFVGLMHTSEEDGVTFDALADTPKCRGTRTDRCADSTNLMMPTTWTDTPIVSASQRAIFQASPLYRAFIPGETARTTGSTTRAARRSKASSHPAFHTHAPTATERVVASSFCSHTRKGLSSLVSSLGRPRVIEELQALAADVEAPKIHRAKATRWLGRLGSP